MTTTSAALSAGRETSPPPYWLATSYAGRPAAMATMHDKAAVLGPVFAAAGIHVVPVVVDTDTLGTFTGDVPRAGGLFDTAVGKARLGAAVSGLALNLASEGDFAPDPLTGLFVVQREAVALVDSDTGLVVLGRAAAPASWVRSWTVTADDDLGVIADEVDLSTHRLVVRPEPEVDGSAVDGSGVDGSRDQADAEGITKGVAERAVLREAVHRAAELAPRVRVETDLRSHVCPPRHAVMRSAAADLVLRLNTRCPQCHRPGFGPEEETGHASCSHCGSATGVPTHVVDRCPTCDHEERRPLVRPTVDPGHCASCNP